jgi:hypothetical protein
MVVVVQFLFLHSQSPESAATNSRDCWANHAGRAYHVVIRKGLKVFRHFVDLGQALRAVGIQDLESRRAGVVSDGKRACSSAWSEPCRRW